jgi:hypothetical protein
MKWRRPEKSSSVSEEIAHKTPAPGVQRDKFFKGKE